MKQLSWSHGQAISSNKGNYYKVVQLLGEGKSAAAYLALKTGRNDRGTFHVVKVLQHPGDEGRLRSFNAEKSVIGGLDHSSIIRICDDGDFAANSTSYPFYVCDFYTKTLGSVIGLRSLKLTQKLSYAIQMCSALAHLEAKSVVHCDVKPNNIYIDGLKCVVADFGLARQVGSVANASELPSLHRYRSPDIVEAIRNSTPLTAKSDVFQLGLVLAEMFTGINPCQPASNGNEKVHVNYLAPVYGQFEKSISTLIESMLEESVNSRPSADKLIDQWQTILFESYGYMLKVEQNVF